MDKNPFDRAAELQRLLYKQEGAEGALALTSSLPSPSSAPTAIPEYTVADGPFGLAGAVSPLDAVPSSSLRLINNPFPGARTYGELFEALARDKMVPLGLLRQGRSLTRSAGPRGNVLPFVLTNPGHSTEIFVGDQVYVLSPPIHAQSTHEVSRRPHSFIQM